MTKSPKHILVIRLSAMGDVAMTVPVLKALTATYPDLKITVLTRKLFVPFFEGIRQVNIHVAKVNDLHKGPLGLYRLATEIQSLQIDAVADLHDVLRSQIIRQILKWKSIPFSKIDKGRSEKAALTRKDNKVFKQLKTSHQRYADVFETIGFAFDLDIQITPKISKLSEKTIELIRLLCPSLDQYNPWIGIAPFAKHVGKTYPIDLMEEVIHHLAEKGYLILLFGGGEKETRLLQAIDNGHENVINMAGKISLTEEMHLIQRLELMISMDSANMHIASFVGTRVLSLWGATHPFAGFYGWGQAKEDALFPDPALYPDLPCSIYGNKVYDGYEDCMRSIEPGEVIRKVESMLSEAF